MSNRIAFSRTLAVQASPELRRAVEQAASARGVTLAQYTRLALGLRLIADGRTFSNIHLHTELAPKAPSVRGNHGK